MRGFRVRKHDPFELKQSSCRCFVIGALVDREANSEPSAREGQQRQPIDLSLLYTRWDVKWSRLDSLDRQPGEVSIGRPTDACLWVALPVCLLQAVARRAKQKADAVDDLVLLDSISEGAIVGALQNRYGQDQIVSPANNQHTDQPTWGEHHHRSRRRLKLHSVLCLLII